MTPTESSPDPNPYASPATPPEEKDYIDQVTYGERGMRGAAVFIDNMIFAATIGVVFTAAYTLGGASIDEFTASGGLLAVLLLIAWLISLGFDLITLVNRSATPGKLYQGLYIADLGTVRPAKTWRVVFLRLLPWWTLTFVGWLVYPPLIALRLFDIVFLFGSRRLALHDRLSGTHVLRGKVWKTRDGFKFEDVSHIHGPGAPVKEDY